MQTIVINVIGLVQGITGKVCNLVNGSVQIMATGSKDQLAKLIDWCRQGPPRAQVINVEWQDAALKIFPDFRVER